MKNTRKIKKLVAPGLCLIAVIFSINALGQKSKYTSEESSELTLVSTMDAKEVSEELKFTPADVNFNYFEKVTAAAKKHRSSRLIDFKTFSEYAKDPNTIILDTRSKRMYDRMHIKGAIHINFADFTQQYLAEMIPSKDTRILIYCNNNFVQEPVFEIPFTTKAVLPKLEKASIRTLRPTETLALNIPTYINLFGYNYKNVYELSELVSSKHRGLEMEGTDAKKLNTVTSGY